MYSRNNTERGFTMKTTLISLSIALGFVGIHLIIGWIVAYAAWLAIILLAWGFLAFALLFLSDMGVVTYDLSKVFSRASR